MMPIPNWNQLHPLVIHFPIALLLVAPLFVIVATLLSPVKGRPFLISALGMMVVGTVSLFFALETGTAAANLLGESTQVKQVLEKHEQLAETTCILFSALTVVFGHLVVLPIILRRELNRTLSTSLVAAFLILYGTGALFLVNTAHQGGRLFHEFGVSAQGATSQAPAAMLPPSSETSAD